MNDRDVAAINRFNPHNGDFLVLKGEGLECRHLRGSKIPFLGRILQKIFYPSFRFKKVVDYILKEDHSLRGVKEESRAQLQDSMNKYFKLTPYGQALNHDKMWERVQQSYNDIFSETQEPEPYSPVERAPRVQPQVPQEPPPPSVEITSASLQPDLYLDSVKQLPESLLNDLPRNRNYFLINLMKTLLSEEEIDSLPEREIHRLIESLESLDQPIILLVRDHTKSWGCQEMPERIQERLDALPPMTYCPLYYDFLNFQQTDPQAGWEPTEEKNLESIRQLKEQLETE